MAASQTSASYDKLITVSLLNISVVLWNPIGKRLSEQQLLIEMTPSPQYKLPTKQ